MEKSVSVVGGVIGLLKRFGGFLERHETFIFRFAVVYMLVLVLAMVCITNFYLACELVALFSEGGN